jgi:hypothetical protein
MQALDSRISQRSLLRCVSERIEKKDNEYDKLYYVQNEDKKKEYARQYYVQNDDSVREAKRRYRLRTEDTTKEYFHQYYLENHANKKDYARQYFLLNKEKKRESNRQYDALNHVQRKEYLRQYQLRNKNKMKESSDRYRYRANMNPNTFRRAPLKSWKSPEIVREYFDSIAVQFHIATYTDWYRISSIQIRHLGGMRIVSFCFCFILGR